MAPTRRPRPVLGLLVLFLWIDGKSLGLVFFPERGPGYHFYSLLGAGWVHFALGILTAALAATATGFLWRPVRGWFGPAAIALGFYIVQVVFAAALMTANLDVAREATTLARRARDLPARPDEITAVVSPLGIWAAAGLLVIVATVLALGAWRHRHYHAPDAGVGV
jgi:hypothetical protein